MIRRLAPGDAPLFFGNVELFANLVRRTAASADPLGRDRRRTHHREFLRLVAPILFGAGSLVGETVCRIEPAAARLQVSFDLPVAVSASVKQALAVRVVEAVGGLGAPTASPGLGPRPAR